MTLLVLQAFSVFLQEVYSFCLCFLATWIWMIIPREHTFKMVWKGNPIAYKI